jgi:molecular chaperone GrpE
MTNMNFKETRTDDNDKPARGGENAVEQQRPRSAASGEERLADFGRGEDGGDASPNYELVDRQAWQVAQNAVAELTEMKDKHLRLQAEFDNFRKRFQREKEDLAKYATENLLLGLLPILDHFDLGLQAIASAADLNAISQGMAMVKTQMERFLEEEGVTLIEAIGKPFDHNLHEAVAHEHAPDTPDEVVLRQVRKGYLLKGRLLRPANVVVAGAASQDAATNNKDNVSE